MLGPVEVVNGLISGLLLGAVLALTALGLSLVLGVMRLVNLAHGELLIGGAYLSLYLLQTFHIDPFVGMPVVALIMALVAYPLQRVLLAPLSDKRAEAAMMTTFGLSVILQNGYILGLSADSRSIDVGYGTAPLSIGPFTTSKIYVLGFIVSVIVVALVYVLVSRTNFGRDLRASAVDPTAAAVLGVDVRRVRALTFALGAACSALGGVLIGVAFTFTPTSGANYLFTGLAIIVLGGIGSIPGTLVGGMFLGVIESVGGIVLGDGWRDFIGLAVFLIVLAVKPEGLVRSGPAR